MGTCFHNAMLVQFDPPLVQPGGLRQVDGTIVESGPQVSAEADDEKVDCDGAVLMPGLVNGHTHLYSALAAGMPAPPRPPRNFHEILKLVWWRLDRAHDLESILLSGQIGALAALRCGTTTVIDHHASPRAIDGSLTALAEGIGNIGCRKILCYEVTDRNYPDEAARGLMENERFAQQCRVAENHDCAAMVGAHASFTLEENSLAACIDLSRRLGVGVHLHVAEDPVDERLTREKFNCGLLERFERHGLLDVPRTIFAHGTHFADADFSQLDHRDSIMLAHNPSSNMNNGVGYTPIGKLASTPLLGTDGIGADMWREARTAQFKSHDAGVPLPLGKPLAMLGATARFASAYLGVELGNLNIGAAADLVVTSYRPATPLTAENLAGHLLYAMGPEYVRHVMIAGQWRLRDGQVQGTDERDLRHRSVDVAQRLYQRMAELE